MSANGEGCSSPIVEPERSALLQEALADSQLQAVKAQLESRGFGMNADEAQAVQLAGGQHVLIPFGEGAHLVWTRANGQTAALGLIRQGNKTLNVSADGQERVVRFLPVQKAEKLLRKLREKQKFQDFEGKLGQKGKRVGRVRVLFDETSKIAIVGIASEGSEKIAHQVRIKLKAGKDDEPEDDAEPAIQATACGQATGEAVPTSATRMQAQGYEQLDPGEGTTTTTGSYDISEGRDYGTTICVSQWGYTYDCRKITPILQVSQTSLLMPLAIIPEPVQASLTVWNAGGGTLRGTVTVSAPFRIVSGGSFNLLPGQPQEVVVRFTPATSGVFSQSAALSSNGGNKTVSLTARAVTYEEYLSINIQVYNSVGQSGAYPVLGVRNSVSLRALLVAGAPQLTLGSFQGLETRTAELGAYQPDPRLVRFLEELQPVSARELNRWLGLLQEAIAQGRFDEEYQRLLGEGLDYVERAIMALLDTSNAEPARQLVYEIASSGWRAPELAQQQYPSEYLNQLRQLMERMFWAASLAEQLLKLAPDLIPGFAGALLKALFYALDVLDLLGVARCSSVSECISRFMEEAWQATFRMAEYWGSNSPEVTEFARSLFEIMDIFARAGRFEDQWGKVFGLLIWMNQGGLARYEQGFSTIVAAARTVRNMPGGSSGWSASLVGIVYQTTPNGIWWGAVMIFTYPTITTTPSDAHRYVAVVGGDHCQACSAKVNDIIAWVQTALNEVKRQGNINNIENRVVTFAFTKRGADVGAVLNALIANFGDSDIPIIVSWTTSDGRVMYMCIGKASACAALGDLAQQIACAQQGQSIYCNAQEVDWRIGKWEAPPPSEEKTPVASLTP